MVYDPDCRTETRVFINRTRIPAGDIDVYLRKEGPMSVNRYAEVEFASSYNGEDFLIHFNAIDGNPADADVGYDICHIDAYDTNNGQYVPLFTGYVTGVGNRSENSRRWSLRAQGPEMLTENIPFGRRYSNATFNTVTNEIAQEIAIASGISVDTDVESLPDGQVLNTANGKKVVVADLDESSTSAVNL